jgi:hypothetical protein
MRRVFLFIFLAGALRAEVIYTIIYEQWAVVGGGVKNSTFSMSRTVADFIQGDAMLIFEASDITGSPFRGYGIDTNLVNIYAGIVPGETLAPVPTFLRVDPPGDGFSDEHLTFHLPFLFYGGDHHGIIAHPQGLEYFAAHRYDLGTFQIYGVPDQPRSPGNQGFDLYTDSSFDPSTYVGTPGGTDIFLNVSQVVPEPATFLLVATALLILARRTARLRDP